HLSDLLMRRRHTVHGTIRRSQPDPRAELAAAVLTHELDLLDRAAVDRLVRDVQPQWVFHLAALSSPAASWDDPGGTIATNAGLRHRQLRPADRADRIGHAAAHPQGGQPRDATRFHRCT